MPEKNVGYALLGIGILTMFAAFLFIVIIFIGGIDPIPVVNINAPSFDTSALVPQIPGLPAPSASKVELIPASDFNKIINLTTNLFFMGFIMSFGFKLADLGVKLIRPIKIEAKS